MLKFFVAVWCLYWAVVALLPVRALYPSTLAAFLLQAAFVLLVVLAYALVVFASGTRRLPRAGSANVAATPTLIRWAIAMSVIGLVALTYDKLYVQQIDYSEGLAFAREEWRRFGEEREGEASSIYSMLGYLFGSAYYVAVVLAITQVSALTARQRMWALLACFVLVVANSALTGGRSSVLLLGAFVIAALAARRGLSLRALVRSERLRRIIKLLVALAVAYTVYVFYARADAGDIPAIEYAIDFLPFLGLEAAPWYLDLLDGGILSSLSAMCVLALSYVTHSFSTVAAIIDAPGEDKTIIFLHVVGILNKLGLAAAPDGDWFLSGRLPSVPGALWHQFGQIGFAAGSLLLGAACAAATAWTAHCPRSLAALGAFTMAGATLILSPALFAGDFLSFPFVFGAFVMLALGQGGLGPRRRARRRRGEYVQPFVVLPDHMELPR